MSERNVRVESDDLIVAGVYGLMEELEQRLKAGYVPSSGIEFKNEVFQSRNYWSDEDSPENPAQFVHFASGYELEWYKHIGRSTYANREVTAREALEIIQDCFKSIENVTEEDDR